MEKYKWIASSDDGSFNDESRQEFTSKEECYNDMRNAVLEKMKLNTEYTEAFNDCESIGYGVTFYQERITHASYKSSVCTYEIKEVNDKKNVALTDSQIQTLIAALRVAIEESQFRFARLVTPTSEDCDAFERIKNSMERENEARNQILELLETI